jgi:DNA-binding IclR family transcriptional regulator
VIGLLSRPSGASLEELIEATSWPPHTTRAALTGLRKRGFVLERARAEGVTTYRISSASQAGAVKSDGGKRAKDSAASSVEAAAA